jgi:hypothetical protein
MLHSTFLSKFTAGPALQFARAILLAIFAVTGLLYSWAQDAPKKNTLPAVLQEHEAGKLRAQIGEQVVVQGRIASTSSSSSGHQFLNFPSKSVRVICFKDDLKNFPGGGPATIYKGKSIALTGQSAQHIATQPMKKSRKQISMI